MTLSISLEQVQIATARSAAFLVNQTQENGMFRYRINLNPAIAVQPKYNILRHAGAIYALATYALSDGDSQPFPDRVTSEQIQGAIARAGQYLRDKTIAPLVLDNNQAAVWSIPEVNHSGKPLQAKLGGTGLGLVALLTIQHLNPDFTVLETLRALGRFIVSMQKANGSFCSKYIPIQGGQVDEWESLYYPGEAALGLVMLSEKDPDAEWVACAYRALQFLAKTREGQTTVPADHWALLATERLLKLSPCPIPLSRDLLLNHAMQICESMLADQVLDSEMPQYWGGFSNDGRTTPTATRLEGLLAARSILPTASDLYARLDGAIAKGLQFLLNAQITEGEFMGGMPRAVAYRSGRSKKITQFNQRVTEVRIDYVQHAMSAMMQYLVQS